MIFYFSGTGNSLWVAKRLGEIFGERTISVAEELQQKQTHYQLSDKEKIFFVMPIHSWGPAILIKQFVKKIVFENYRSQAAYAVFTCGDNCGQADKILAKLLKKRGVTLTKSYSIQMPNDYILMKSFGVDSEEMKEKKLRAAPGLLQEIVENITEHKKAQIYTAGKSSFLKSKVIYPIFCRFAVKKNEFYATEKCISCGTCADICPTQNIVMEKIKPKWGKNCVQCTACINRCPVRAVEYGKITLEQGRYHHPDVD